MKQGQRLKLKWSLGDIDRLVAAAAKGQSARQIAEQLKGTTLESEPDEIVRLVLQAGGRFPNRSSA